VDPTGPLLDPSAPLLAPGHALTPRTPARPAKLGSKVFGSMRKKIVGRKAEESSRAIAFDGRRFGAMDRSKLSEMAQQNCMGIMIAEKDVALSCDEQKNISQFSPSDSHCFVDANSASSSPSLANYRSNMCNSESSQNLKSRIGNGVSHKLSPSSGRSGRQGQPTDLSKAAQHTRSPCVSTQNHALTGCSAPTGAPTDLSPGVAAGARSTKGCKREKRSRPPLSSTPEPARPSQAPRETV